MKNDSDQPVPMYWVCDTVKRFSLNLPFAIIHQLLIRFITRISGKSQAREVQVKVVTCIFPATKELYVNFISTIICVSSSVSGKQDRQTRTDNTVQMIFVLLN